MIDAESLSKKKKKIEIVFVNLKISNTNMIKVSLMVRMLINCLFFF